MSKNLLMCLIVSSFILCGCTERTRQKGVLGLSDPALATKQDAEEIKKEIAKLKKELIQRLDRIEKR